MKTTNFSLLGAVRQALAGKFEDETMEVITEGRSLAKEKLIETSGNLIIPMDNRALTITGNDFAGNSVSYSFIEALRAENVLSKAGAKLVTELKYDLTVPSLNAVNVVWSGESDTTDEASSTLTSAKYTPKRLTANVTISKQLLLQTNGMAEAIVINDLIAAIAGKLESTILGKHESDTILPDGLFTGQTDLTLKIKGTATRDNILELESIVGAAGNIPRDSRAYIINEAGNTILKKTPKITGSDKFVLEGGMMNDTPVFITNHVPSGLTSTEDEHGIVYGNFSNLILASWGILDLVINPFSSAAGGSVDIIINSFWDIKPRNAAAFAVGSFK